METLRYFNDRNIIREDVQIDESSSIRTKIEFYNAESGEQIFEPLHNKTVIAGSALVAMKLFNLDRTLLLNTPTYDAELGLNDAAAPSTYPMKTVTDADGFTIGSFPDECSRKIMGFCIGQGGGGLDPSDIFDVKYASWITPDNLVPFRYPLQNADTVDEGIYKGKKTIQLSNGQFRNAYYFKTFSNTPACVQNYTSAAGSFADYVTAGTVYKNEAMADMAQTYVELHLKVTKDDTREFFLAHKGLTNAKINQLSLVSAWPRDVSRLVTDSNGNTVETTITTFAHIRPFSLVNIPVEILSDPEKSVSIVYTLYF